jgi:hypothetical protein
MGPVAHTPQTGDARSWPETGNLSQVAWNETTARLLIVVRARNHAPFSRRIVILSFCGEVTGCRADARLTSLA